LKVFGAFVEIDAGLGARGNLVGINLEQFSEGDRAVFSHDLLPFWAHALRPIPPVAVRAATPSAVARLHVRFVCLRSPRVAPPHRSGAPRARTSETASNPGRQTLPRQRPPMLQQSTDSAQSERSR